MNRYSGDTRQTVVCKLIKEEDLNDKAREKAREEVRRMRKARRAASQSRPSEGGKYGVRQYGNAVTFAAFSFGDTGRRPFAGSWCGG